MKKCTKCNKIKPLTEFNKMAKAPGGLNYWCRDCYKQLNSDRYDRDKDKIVSRVKKWQKEHPDKERDTLRSSAWQKANPAKQNAIVAKRNAAKLQRTPKWLSKRQFVEILRFYEKARELTEINKESYEVDHIIPLQGRNVSGLHVPWNLKILTKSENCFKSNKFEMAG